MDSGNLQKPETKLGNIKFMKLRGLSFSWKRAIGITQAKQELARKTGIPTSKAGLERKIGTAILKTIFVKGGKG